MVCSKTTKNCKSGHEASWGAWGARAHPEKQGEEPVVGSKGGRESAYTAGLFRSAVNIGRRALSASLLHFK